MKNFIFLISLLFSTPSWSDEISWLAGIYVDTLNKVNVKGGIVLNDEYEYDEKQSHYFGSFKYIDLEAGLEGNKISFGVGHHIGHGLDRIGLSYASLKQQDLAGIEAVISQMGVSVKLGYYAGLNGTSDKWLFGIGLGF